jgi:hypothetical protein
MKKEAVGLHHVHADRVTVTGAAAYDHWFEWQPRTTREEFCRRTGLDPSRPYILYLCSSKFIAPNERPFVRQWIAGVRGASAALRDVGVLVRPHPQNVEQWRDESLADIENAGVWPPHGANPVDADSRAEYYDSMYHSAAVVGVNTSAPIERAIVGRVVYKLLAREFRGTQEGTLHFRHLRDVSGGLLHVAADMGDHAAQLEDAIRDPQEAARRCRGFVEAFLRPYGLAEPAAPRLVSALESVMARPCRRSHDPWLAAPVRALLAGLARRRDVAIASGDGGDKTRRKKAKPRKLEERAEAKPRVDVADAGGDAAPATAVAGAPVATVADGRASSDLYRHYLCARERARALRSGSQELTPAEAQTLAALQSVWDATPDTLCRFWDRRAATSGMRSTDGVEADPAMRRRLERDVRRLLERGDPALWIDEPPAFSGATFDWKGRRYSEDTVLFFRAISLLQDASLLKPLRGSVTPATVWEIGGGWGGFAYYLKSVCPDVTYLITGHPEWLLLAATNLKATFPTATFRFFDSARPRTFAEEWSAVDFAFAPENAIEQMQLPHAPELVIDFAALEQMTPARTERHLRRAHDLAARHLLSIGPRAATGSADTPAIRQALDRFYWPHPLSAAGYLAKRLGVDPADAAGFFLGWRRLRT